MKKKYLFSLILMFAVAIAMVFVGATTLTPRQSSFAEEEPVPPPVKTIFDFVTISQEGYVFSYSDFEESTVGTTIYQNLYTNKTVTITLDVAVKTGDYFRIEEVKNGVTTPIGDTDTRVLVLNGVKSYVFDASSITEDTTTQLTIVYEEQMYDSKNKEYYTDVYSINLNLIQITNNFFTSKEFKWDYILNNAPKQVAAPSIGYEYPPLTLTIPNGTPLNPIFIRFVYCGETYEIYNVDGYYYNSLDKTPLSFSKLNLTKSGTYSVEIYDKTATCGYKQSNYLKYDFTIENNDANNRYAPFYINATVSNGSQLMNNQISNEKTTVEFVNLNMIKRYVDKIVVLKSYRPTGGENITDKTEYTSDELPPSLTFDSDGTYHIQVIGINNGNLIREFEFILIESIRSFFEVDGTRYEIKKDEPSNQTKTVPIERTVESTYDNILGKTTYTFNVIIARSAPSINGVSNNERTSRTVKLTANGVGKINVTVSQDGKTHSLEIKNGEEIGSFSKPGKYFVKITDEMGTTITKNFTVTVQMNGAAIALIVIGAAIIFLIIIVAVVSRSRVKVR
ncbi:MAG: hypothetical protein IKC11_01215 [Clostridia bacterium]|nr:hypothetical protein [Clostridia bacterium]